MPNRKTYPTPYDFIRAKITYNKVKGIHYEYPPDKENEPEENIEGVDWSPFDKELFTNEN